MKIQSYPWPSFSDEEIEAAAAVLRSNKVNYWTGEEGRTFETEYASWCGTKHAVAVANGTLALDLALRALGIGPGDEVVVTPRTFIASVSSVVGVGATPVFADVERDSGNISARTIAEVLGPRTRAILPVHIGGWPCEMDEIMLLAGEHDLAVIEDCAQGHGAKVGSRNVGSFGQVGAWSFCQDKILTTGGEGGMVTTDDDDLWNAMWSFKDHGKSWNAVYKREHAPGFRWLHESFGTNWRMLEVQAAIGRIQLRRLKDWTRRRTENAMAIANALQSLSDIVSVPMPREGLTHAYYRLYAYLHPEAFASGWDRDRLIMEMSQAGIPAFHGTCSEVYLEKAFEGTGLRPPQRLPNASMLGETSIMFLTHPTIEASTAQRMGEEAARIIGNALR